MKIKSLAKLFQTQRAATTLALALALLLMASSMADAFGAQPGAHATRDAQQGRRVEVTSPADSGAGSLRDAVAAAEEGDVIAFNFQISGDGSGGAGSGGDGGVNGGGAVSGKMTIALSSGEIVLDKALSFDGGAAGVVIDGSAVDRIFNYEGAGALAFSDISFIIGGDENVAGADIITVDFSGGAVRAPNGSVSATRCEFSGAKNFHTKDGGAVYAFSVSLTNCVFVGNTAIFGGAVSALGAASAARCSFIGNTGIEGGAVMAKGGFSANGCVFNGNTAQHMGGAVMAQSGFAATRCVFIENKAVHGGAAFAMRPENDAKAAAATLADCAFFRNEADPGDGRIWYVASVAYDSGIPAASTGGALSAHGNIVAANCAFVGNSAGTGGGATHYVSSGFLRRKRKASENSNGALYTRDDKIIAKDCEFIGNFIRPAPAPRSGERSQ